MTEKSGDHQRVPGLGGEGEDTLEARLAAAEARQARPSAPVPAENKGWAMGVEFVGAVLVSTFIGWGIDRWAHTAPFAMMGFLILGFMVGVRGAVRASAVVDAQQGDVKTKEWTRADDDDDE